MMEYLYESLSLLVGILLYVLIKSIFLHYRRKAIHKDNEWFLKWL